MKKIFIAYANERMTYSLKRIGRQAKRLGYFDDVILWTPQELPQYVQESELMRHTLGGGYWVWKPVILFETLQKYEEGTLVCYVDAGCTLHRHEEWDDFFHLMRDKDFLCFKYKDEMPNWEHFGCISSKIKYWTKKDALLFLDDYVGTSDYREENKVMGGILFAKGKSNPIIKEWLDISLNHPEVILNPDPDRLSEEYPYYAHHRHDQPVLTALTYKYRDNLVILPESFDNPDYKGAIVASRIRAKTWADYVKWKLKRIVKGLFSDIK